MKNIEVTLYQALTLGDIETDNHESDLFFPKTERSSAILRKFPLHEKNSSKFYSEGRWWYEVPFAYDPW